MSTAKGHIPALDGLRGIAILLVLFHHYTFFTPISVFDRFLKEFTQSGWLGVDLFFVLSGFLITRLLLDAKGTDHYFRNFYARRSLRIFPLYYAYLFALYCVFKFFPSQHVNNLVGAYPTDYRYWLYLSNFSIASDGGFSSSVLKTTWSLAIEEQFYLIWPFLVWKMSRQRLIRICLFSIVAAFFVRTYFIYKGLPAINAYVLPFCRIDSLAMGALVSMVALPLKTVRVVGLVAFSALTGLIAMRSCRIEDPWILSIGLTLMAVVGGASVLEVLGNKENIFSKILMSSLLRCFGKYSYAIYLFHLVAPIILWPIVRFGQIPTLFGSQLPGQCAYYVLASASSLLLAVLSYHLFEKHALSLKRYFPTKLPG